MFLSFFMYIKLYCFWWIIYIYSKESDINNIIHSVFCHGCFWTIWHRGCCRLALVRIHVGENFMYIKLLCFVIDYEYKCEFADSYVTSLVPVCHMQGGYDLVDVLTMCLWFFHNVMMCFLAIVVFYHVGGVLFDFGVSFFVVWKQL